MEVPAMSNVISTRSAAAIGAIAVAAQITRIFFISLLLLVWEREIPRWDTEEKYGNCEVGNMPDAGNATPPMGGGDDELLTPYI
jgi:hypothetical protein